MTKTLTHTLYWNWNTTAVYRHGAVIQQFPDKSVHLSHPLLAAGMVLTEWSSRQTTTNSLQPPFPLLNRGDAYTLSCNFHSFPERTAYLKIEYFDKFNQLIKYTIIKEAESPTITLPLQTAHYVIKLISAGCSEVFFENISLSNTAFIPYDVDRFWVQQTDWNASADTLCILFSENNVNGQTRLQDDELPFPNTIVINSSYNAHQLYLNRELQQAIKQKIQQLQETKAVRQLVFVGYGPISNMAALFFKEAYTDSFAAISNTFYPILDYYQLTEKNRSHIDSPNFHQLYLSQFDNTVFHYEESTPTNLLNFLQEAKHTLSQLKQQNFLQWQTNKHEKKEITL